MNTLDVLIWVVSAPLAVAAASVLCYLIVERVPASWRYERTGSPASQRDAGDAAPVSNTGAKLAPVIERESDA